MNIALGQAQRVVAPPTQEPLLVDRIASASNMIEGCVCDLNTFLAHVFGAVPKDKDKPTNEGDRPLLTVIEQLESRANMLRGLVSELKRIV